MFMSVRLISLSLSTTLDTPLVNGLVNQMTARDI